MKRLGTVSVLFSFFPEWWNCFLISLHSLFHLFQFALKWKWAVAHFAAWGGRVCKLVLTVTLLHRVIRQPVDFQTFFAFIFFLFFILTVKMWLEAFHNTYPLFHFPSPSLFFFFFVVFLFLPCSCKVLVFHKYKLKHYYQSE